MSYASCVIPYAIRSFRGSDAAALAKLTTSAITVVGSVRYSEIQVAAWAARHNNTELFLERHEKGDLIWVAVSQAGLPIAYCLLEQPADDSAHLDMLYCHPDHTRKGLASKLLASAENYARTYSVKRLYTEASELARPTFERAGYSIEQRQDFTIAHKGEDVPIHNFAMQKLLG